MVVTVIINNIHRPRFNYSRYNATVMEYNALTGAGMAAGSTVAQVLATDLDSMNDPAGQIEYTITSGNQLGIFDIPNPIVSYHFTLNIVSHLHLQQTWGGGLSA